MKPNCTFPETVEYKSCTATIYRQQHREAERFEVRYYDVDGSLQRLTFPTCGSAKEFAGTAVKELAANRAHFITLRGRQAMEYQTALEILAPLGVSLLQVATLMAKAHQLLGGQATVAEAIKVFRPKPAAELARYHGPRGRGSTAPAQAERGRSRPDLFARSAGSVA